MYMRLLLFNIIVFCLTIKSLSASNSVVDSLWQRYRDASIENNDSLAYKLCHRIAYISNEPKVKVFFSQKAYDIGVKNSNVYWQGAARFLNSNAYLKLMALDSALICLQESQELYRSVNHKEGVAVCKSKMADVYKRNNELDKAERGYKDAIQLLTQVESYKNLAKTYVNLGELYRTNEMFTLALDCFHKADSVYDLTNVEIGFAYPMGNRGLVLIAIGQLDSAEVCLEKSIEILEPLKDYYAASSFYDGLAQIFFLRKDYKKSKEFARKSLNLAEIQDLKEQVRDANLRLSSIYNQSKEYKKAFFHHKQYVAYRDSINNVETIRKIANLNAKFKLTQKQKEVDKEKADKEQYLIVLIALVSIIGLLLVLGYFMLKVSRVRKKANNELEKQHKELELANTTKNKFFSILSHDLRSPLASFHGYSEVIDLCIDHNDLGKLSDISKEMQFSSANMLDLLDNLLQWGVNQMDTQQVVLTVVDLKEIVKIEVNHLMHVSSKKSISVDIDIEDNCAIYVDRVRLSIAIRNLINNAIKFTREGGTVFLIGKRKKNTVKLKIKDNGVGMTSKQKKSLFDFNEITSTYGTRNEKGVGLGMQLVCEFVKSSKAKINVDSEVGEGTTFTIIFMDRRVYEE